ncbi:hypothetical protein MCOR02_004179 [Pyricularia oryzae]|uniref:Carboxymuconolactone decarboxylase n=4 Tax=Pyricularia TaxID=48558 RepID=A0ABQ8P1J7_PYRGI|nr:uncharacterized protein MGG_09204 [Pyricularia oryzae 70-15]ELQ41390.1 hypothetical protein OOU_Y34scaffold00283g84 [Pyricularia oryzae Y34]KAH8842047.1 hypothetical protein MCOR01_005986 [Pyricularia oryzae]KAI6303926.1 hypothetical protein MCOR33_000910 [Pyricularia grisea]EHA57207.1 hypothetical protein MGG_09204 [Pyricularia oryzae 70-15]KAH9435229.1 hypothetical protein MCOR02_004179 [Pyricularia oryzae]
MAAQLPAVITPALLASIRKQPHLPRNTWYFVAATTLAVLNRPDEIPTVYKHVLTHGVDHGTEGAPSPEEQLTISRRMREALVKTAAIGGLPKTINALLELKKHTPEQLVDEPLAFSPTSRPLEMYDVPSSQILHRGQRFFDMIYGKVSKRVMGQMDRSGTEDLGLTARLVYGYLLSNTAVLTPAETSFVLIAGLIPQDVNPQLKGHLKGALNGGATVDEVKAVRNIAMAICESAGMRMLDKCATGGWGWRTEPANL